MVDRPNGTPLAFKQCQPCFNQPQSVFRSTTRREPQTVATILHLVMHVKMLILLSLSYSAVFAQEHAFPTFSAPDPHGFTHPKVVGGRQEHRKDVIAWQALILRNGTSRLFNSLLLPILTAFRFLISGKVHCGGSLISYNKVLSAAHCNIDGNLAIHSLLIGASRINNDKRYPIMHIFMHDEFHYGPRGEPINDIMVIEFLNKNRSIAPFYPTINTNPKLPLSSSTVFVSGFGLTSPRGIPSSRLMTASVNLIDPKYCKDRYRGISMENRICAGSVRADSCLGDSGAGLYSVDKKRRNGQKEYTLLGIVSFGAGCARFQAPGIYARVSSHNNWISNVMKKPSTPDFIRSRLIFGWTIVATVIHLLLFTVVITCIFVSNYLFTEI